MLFIWNTEFWAPLFFLLRWRSCHIKLAIAKSTIQRPLAHSPCCAAIISILSCSRTFSSLQRTSVPISRHSLSLPYRCVSLCSRGAKAMVSNSCEHLGMNQVSCTKPPESLYSSPPHSQLKKTSQFYFSVSLMKQ